jgi:hypothetical protein
LAVAGCTRPASPPAPPTAVETALVPFGDQRPTARPRWLDIGDVAYAESWCQEYRDEAAHVTLRYQPQQPSGHFQATLRARGLKPNFCYQLKLMGRPPGLWPDGDGVLNEWLGRHGRWWDYRYEKVVDNFTNDTVYDRLPAADRGWVVGYVYFGCVVTDGQGNLAATPLTADHSYHVTGLPDQDGFLREAPGTRREYPLDRSGPAYAPGTPAGPATIFLEGERDDPVELPPLPAGRHHLVLMLTEESFHARDRAGGSWRSAFVTDWPTSPSPQGHRPWVTQPGTPLLVTMPASAAATEVAILNPRDGDQLAGEAVVQIRAPRDAKVEWAVDDGPWQPTTLNPESGFHEADWATSGAQPHRLRARATTGSTTTEAKPVSVAAS